MSLNSQVADSSPVLSVVIPLYNEQETISELYQRNTTSLESHNLSYEIVFVNDGSQDATSSILDGLQRDDHRIAVIHLSRNFGHQAAVSAGLDYASGQAVIVMDGDLQDPPEVIGQFLQLWRDGNEVVYAIRQNRKEGVVKKTGYYLFYRLLNMICDIDIPIDSGDFCLMDRKVVDVIKHLPERLRFIRGLRSFAGFRQVGLCYDRAARAAGEPKYNFRALIKLAVDGLVSFSSYPLHLVTYLGIASAAVAILLTVWVFIDAVYAGSSPRGWASMIVVVLVMGSIQLISLGIMGEYIRRIFVETKGRPTYIVRSFLKTDRSRPEEATYELPDHVQEEKTISV